MLEAIKSIFTAKVSDPSTWGTASATDHLLVAGIIVAAYVAYIGIAHRIAKHS